MQRENVVRLFEAPPANNCCVYIVGHEHAKHGHAVKVGIASKPKVRVGELQVGNPDEIKSFAVFRFERRAIAQEVEFRFHDSGLVDPIRGEWVAGHPNEVMLYLTYIITEVLGRAYPDVAKRRQMRRSSGLVDSFDILDRTLTDEQQERCNLRYARYEGLDMAGAGA